MLDDEAAIMRCLNDVQERNLMRTRAGTRTVVEGGLWRLEDVVM
jgi:hypothetical protein